MKLLGYLFVLALLLAGIGYVRGWFTVEAASNADQANVKLSVDRDRMSADGRAVIDTVGGTRNRTDANAPATTPLAATSLVEGRITAVDVAALEITVDVASRTSIHRVSAAVPITRSGARIDFAQLRPNMQARLSFDGALPTPNLLGVEVLR